MASCRPPWFAPITPGALPASRMGTQCSGVTGSTPVARALMLCLVQASPQAVQPIVCVVAAR